MHVSPEMTHLFGGGGWDSASEKEGGRERDRDNLTGTVISHFSNEDQTDGAVEGVGSGGIDRGGDEAGLRLFGVRLGEAGRRGEAGAGGGDVSIESSNSNGVALTSNIEKLRHKCEQVVHVCSLCGCIPVYLYVCLEYVSVLHASIHI